MPMPAVQIMAMQGALRARPTVALRSYVCTRCLLQLEASRGSQHRRRIHTRQFIGARPTQAVQRRSVTAQWPSKRGKATGREVADTEGRGPLEEYDERVHSHRLRDDEFQRTIVAYLQDLHDDLRKYEQPPVVKPSIAELKPRSKYSISRLFGSKEEKSTSIPDSLPKGLYMYGDVGSGKTMLMDLFYDTLPLNIENKTRIHFHNFMQDVHKRMHGVKRAHGDEIDAIALVAAQIAEGASVLCFDEFQCTDVADAMILRRLIEGLMHHGVVIVTTSNRHPTDLYKNGIQRQSFIPCIDLLLDRLRVICLDSPTDYRKIPRPPSGVYHHPLDAGADTHAEKWFHYLGDFKDDPPHPAEHEVWGRKVIVPQASGRAARFDFWDLMGKATGAADYLELVKYYDAFIVTGVPGMTYRERDLARRFITFIDAIYESRAKIVLTTAVPLARLFLSPEELTKALSKSDAAKDNSAANEQNSEDSSGSTPVTNPDDPDFSIDSAARLMMDDLGLNMKVMSESGLFSGDEERFAFSRALSRLSEMGSQEWVERGMDGGEEAEVARRVRSKWREDQM